MVRAKPDCTGKRFGMLTVLGKGDRIPERNTSVQLWRLQCDCGEVVQRRRSGFDRKQATNSSCGCAQKERITSFSKARAKPDCTGEIFGQLTVLGKDETNSGFKLTKKGQKQQLWILECSCGRIIKKPRGDFEISGQVSCGCARSRGLVDNKARPIDITGKRFGQLKALRLAGNKSNGKQLWLLQCDCGAVCKKTHSLLKRYEAAGYQINCGGKTHKVGLWYPPTPSPYPSEAGEIVAKYLHRARTSATKIDTAIQDEIMDRLLRSAWILTYRRQRGEVISELQEKRYINKCLRYASTQVRLRRRLEQHGGLMFTIDGKAIQIGGKMTDLTSNHEAVNETQPEVNLSTGKPLRRLKYRRC